MPLSPHTAARRQGRIRGAGPGTLCDASSRATKAFYLALSLCDMIFSGVFEPPSAPDTGHPGIAGGNTARVYNFDVAKLTVPA